MSHKELFEPCFDHARKVDASLLLPVRVLGSHGAMLHSALEDLHKRNRDLVHVLKSGRHLLIEPDAVSIAPDAKDPRDVSFSMQIIAGLFKDSVLPVHGPWQEPCRMTDTWDWEASRKKKTAIYPRTLRGYFGLAYFSTSLVPYSYDANGKVHVVLAVSAKKTNGHATSDMFDLIGGNIKAGKRANANMAEEANEETCGGIRLNNDLRSRHGRTTASVFWPSLRTTRIENSKVLNGFRRLYELPIRQGEEKNWVPQQGEMKSFHAVSLDELLEAWKTDDPTHPYALGNFKHIVPLTLVAFAAHRSLIKPTPELMAALNDTYRFPAGQTPPRGGSSILLPKLGANVIA